MTCLFCGAGICFGVYCSTCSLLPWLVSDHPSPLPLPHLLSELSSAYIFSSLLLLLASVSIPSHPVFLARLPYFDRILGFFSSPLSKALSGLLHFEQDKYVRHFCLWFEHFSDAVGEQCGLCFGLSDSATTRHRRERRWRDRRRAGSVELGFGASRHFAAWRDRRNNNVRTYTDIPPTYSLYWHIMAARARMHITKQASAFTIMYARQPVRAAGGK